MLILKPSHYRPRHKNQVNSYSRTRNKSIPIPILKPTSFRPKDKNKVIVEQNQVNSDPYTEMKSSSSPHNEIKSISTTHTKTKSSSMLTLPSDFRPAHKNKVDFDHPHENYVNRSPSQNKSFSARTQKPSPFRSPR